MSAAALSLAAVMALATDPRCGAAVRDSEFASRLTAIALHESGGDPFVIGVNAVRERGLPAAAVRSATAQEAAVRARALLAQGRSLDLGLMQINTAQLARHGLTVETAFDACASMAAGADHFAGDVQAVWSLAHRRYNTGGTERGAGYAAGIEQVLARVRARQAMPPASPQPPLAPQQHPLDDDPDAPPEWDVWARTTYARRPSVGATEIPVAPDVAVPLTASAAEGVAAAVASEAPTSTRTE